MQKALSSGCDSLRTLAEGKLKHALVNVLFLLSELSGHAKWNAQTYATALGITVSALDDLVQATQHALIDVEALILAIHETLQDFTLFFQWLLERIRIHTNWNRLRGETSSAAICGGDSGNSSSSKSLLNLRRLCDFLQRAAEAAQRFRQQQPSHSAYKVETTFGNLVSLQLLAQPIPSKGRTGQSGAGLLTLIKCIHDQWSAMLDTVVETLAQTIRREKSGCVTIGSTSNAVEECHIHWRQPFINLRSKEITTNEDQSDDDKSDEETIDWNSLKHYGHMRDDQAYCSTIMIGFRLQSGVLLLLRALQRVDFLQLRHKSSSRLTWDTAVINFSGRPRAGAVVCRSFDFYGDGSPDKQERLAFVLDRAIGDQVHQEWLYLQPYDNVEFTHANSTVSFETSLAQSVTHTFIFDDARGRAIASSSDPSQSGKNATSVISAASRGILCVTFLPSRLAVFDAEDCEDNDSQYDDGVIGN
ncbi:unnamed protein product [Peronospora destructor]|uniref:Anaphase-promoting complex subunit 4 long domain-containing protein n=1 Tax=Peronospora destructor TaxID=86335 RepID=A0AAV0V8Z8_9STRA|nr:unnamed protein product [Peronospora destructor]